MNHTFGRFLGLIRIIGFSLFIILITLMMPIDVYYQSIGNYPSSLLFLYNLEWFHWQFAVVIISYCSIFGLGSILIWIGWRQTHALDIKPINPIAIAEEHRKLSLKKTDIPK